MPESSAGAVTFLFTDIEGSTRLWDQAEAAMSRALAAHDGLLRKAIDAAGGRVFKTVGDAFCAAFPDPTGAAFAAIAAQRGLREIKLQGTANARLRVRMAIHTGVAESRDGDYFGPALNRVARVLALGHGDQVLVSAATCALLADRMPPGFSLQALGEFVLKDLSRAEAVSQLCHPDLPDRFPPLRGVEARRGKGNLPRPPTSFIGREAVLDRVLRLLDGSRCVTLVGSGGCGKTRVAIEAANRLRERLPDGAWFVDLAPLAEESLVHQALLDSLGIDADATGDPIETAWAHLADRELLVVLDNCEHVLDAAARTAASLLDRCPRARLLATGREPLRLATEMVFRVPSLSVEPSDASGEPEAVRLFVERARQVQPSLRPCAAELAAIASVCRRLDGIPLAIELAAARMSSLGVAEIESRLDRAFALLTRGVRTALPRQQTLRSLVDWSYDLLSPAERRLFERLSVFKGGWSLDGAEMVCCGEDLATDEIMDLTLSLVDKSLVEGERGDRGTRFRLGVVLGQYAAERLHESGDPAIWHARHLEYFLRLAESAARGLGTAGGDDWLDLLELEHDNMRSALQWAAGAGDREQGLLLAGTLARFWDIRGHFAEGRARLGDLLARHDGGCTPGRALAANAAGVLACRQGDHAEASRRHAESLALRRELGDLRGVAASLNNLGVIAYEQGDLAESLRLHRESLALKRSLGDESGLAASLNNLGNVLADLGDREQSRLHHEESLAIRRRLGDRHGTASTLINLGILAAEDGDPARAELLYRESLRLEVELGDRHGIAHSLEGLGAALAACRPDDAALAWGAAERLREDLGSPMPPHEDVDLRAQIARARSAAGDTGRFDRSREAGRNLALEEVLARLGAGDGSGGPLAGLAAR